METIDKSAGMPASIPAVGSEEATRPARDGRTTLGALIDTYMSQYAGKDGTRAQRLRYWSDRLGHIPIGDLIDDDVADAVDDLGRRPARHFMGPDADGRPIFKTAKDARRISGSTVNRYIAALSAVCTYAQKKRLTPRTWVNPVRHVDKREENAPRLRYLEQPEIERLLVACKAQKWAKLHTFVLMALCSGCRRGELEGLRWKDLDLVKGHAHLADSKNGEPRTVALLPQVIEDLLRVKADAKPNDLLFTSTRRPGQPFNSTPQWAAALKAAGIRGVTVHTLRHTAASTLVMSGASLHEVGKVLGHRTVSMTARYAHLSVEHTTAVVLKGLGHIGIG